MGFELRAFVGKTSALQSWKARLPSAVVCHLGGDLSLVPVTGSVYRELRALLGETEAKRLDAQRPGTFPSPSYEAAVTLWGKEASADTTIAYVDVGEFGNQSHEEATLWSRGKELISEVKLDRVFAHFRKREGLDLGDRPIEVELERYRGENAADKWAAADG